MRTHNRVTESGVRIRNAIRGTHAYKALDPFREFIVENTDVEIIYTRATLMDAAWEEVNEADAFSAPIRGTTVFISLKSSQRYSGEELDRMWV